MAQITASQVRQYGPAVTGMIPRATLAAIGADELEDRLHQASALVRKAAAAATPGEGRQFGEQAARILAARPRAETEQIVVAKMAESRLIGDPSMAAALVQQARDELLQHPPAAPRRGAPVVKAKAAAEPDEDTLMAIYNQAGNLTHVGYPRDLTPVLPDPGVQARNTGPVKAGGTTGTGQPRRTGPPEALPADGPQEALPGDVPGRQVVKAKPPGPEQVIKGLGPEWMPVHDWTGRLAGAVRRSYVTPLPAGQVLKGAAAADRANVYDARRRRVGTARLADIIPLAGLRASR